MQIHFESDYQKKVLYVSFGPGSQIRDRTEIDPWRAQWTEVLKSWHSPYKAIIDCRNLQILGTSPDVQGALDRMFRLLKSFFLRKVAGWGRQEGKGHESLPFEVFSTEAEALEALGIRERVPKAGTDDFRAMIHIDNHFEQKTVELSFQGPVSLDKEKLVILKSKLTNNLMQWHSQWDLLVDCSNLEIPEPEWEEFQKMLRFFKGFFLRDLVGYSPAAKGLSYPFPVYRARHRAAALIKGDGTESGRDANCNTRKIQTPNKE